MSGELLLFGKEMQKLNLSWAHLMIMLDYQAGRNYRLGIIFVLLLPGPVVFRAKYQGTLIQKSPEPPTSKSGPC